MASFPDAFRKKFVSTGDVSVSATFSTNLSLYIFACNEIWWSVQIIKLLIILLPLLSLYLSISSNLNPRFNSNVIEVQPYFRFILLEMVLQNKRQSKSCS